MVIRADAQSLGMLSALANDPPLNLRRYPPVPPPHDPHGASNQNRLKLYVVRVPNSHDIILTPFKPQSASVTAEDILSCLYYLRVQATDQQSNGRPHVPPRGASFDDAARPSLPRGSVSSQSTRSERFVPGVGSSTSLTSITDVLSSANFEITFIRRDRVGDSQTTVGRIYSNGNPVLDSTHLLPNSFASQMMAQESLRGRRGRRDRKRLNLEIWTEGYRKFLCASRKTSSSQQTADAFLWPVPIPPAAPGMEDAGPPAPPLKDSPKKAAMLMNPAMERMVYQSRFTEIYSPDTPTAPRLRGITEGADSDGDDDGDDGIFRRTLNLEGEGFWKLTGKRLSALGAAHRRRKSQDPSQAYPPTQPAHNRYNVDEEARVAMEQMGLYSPPSCAASAAGATDADRHDKETKGKGYVFDAPLPGTGSCEFETNSVGRKIRLRLHPPGTIAGSPFGNTAPVKPDPILLCTLSLQPPDALSQSSSGSGVGAGHSHSHSHSQSRASIKLNKLGERFKAKAGRLHRESSWTEHVEQEAGSGQRSKLGSLLIEGEGMDVLDLVVVSSMGVFWKRYCEWTEDLREGGL